MKPLGHRRVFLKAALIAVVSASPAFAVAPNSSCRLRVTTGLASSPTAPSQNPCAQSQSANRAPQSATVVRASDLAAQLADLRLGQQEIQMLIATAKTAAEHLRLAGYYSLRADSDLAQAMFQQKMAIDYSANALGSSSKFSPGTVDHCVAIGRRLKQHAAKMRKLQEEQEQLARQSGE